MNQKNNIKHALQLSFGKKAFVVQYHKILTVKSYAHLRDKELFCLCAFTRIKTDIQSNTHTHTDTHTNKYTQTIIKKIIIVKTSSAVSNHNYNSLSFT